MLILPLLSEWTDLIWDFWDDREVADCQPRRSPQAFYGSSGGREAAGKESFWKSSQYEPEEASIIVSALLLMKCSCLSACRYKQPLVIMTPGQSRHRTLKDRSHFINILPLLIQKTNLEVWNKEGGKRRSLLRKEGDSVEMTWARSRVRHGDSARHSQELAWTSLIINIQGGVNSW